MTEMIECPQCRNTFVVPPGRCPDCGAEVTGSGQPTGRDVVVQYRLNHLAAAGGVALAGFVAGSVTWFLGRQGFGVALFLVALVWAGLLLLRE